MANNMPVPGGPGYIGTFRTTMGNTSGGLPMGTYMPGMGYYAGTGVTMAPYPTGYNYGFPASPKPVRRTRRPGLTANGLKKMANTAKAVNAAKKRRGTRRNRRTSV